MSQSPPAGAAAQFAPAVAEVLRDQNLLELIALQAVGEPAGDEARGEGVGATDSDRLGTWADLRAVSRDFRRAAQSARVVRVVAQVQPAGAETYQGVLRAARLRRNWALGRFRRFTLPKDLDPVRCVAFSPDGIHLASSSRGCIVRLWDLRSLPASFTPLVGHHGCVNEVCFAGDGTRLASGSEDCTARVWSLRGSPKVVGVLVGHSAAVHSVSFARDRMRLASGSLDHTVRLWDLRRVPPASIVLPGHHECASSLSFSCDDRWLASASRDRKVRVWGLDDPPSLIAVLEAHRDWVSALSFDPAGLRLATAGWDGRVCLWNLTSTPIEGRVLGGHHKGMLSLAFSPGGGLLASASWDCTVRLWHLQARPIVSSVLVPAEREGPIRTLSISPDGARLAYSSYQSVVVLDFEPGTLGEPGSGAPAMTAKAAVGGPAPCCLA